MTERPLRIAVTSYYLPSESKIGAGYVAHRLANVMVSRGHEVTMFSPCARPNDALYEHSIVPIAGRWRTFRWGIEVAKLDLRDFDVVHSHGDNHFRIPWSSPPVVRTMHGSCFAEALRIHGVKERIRMVALGVTEVIGSLTATKTVAISNATVRWYPWIRSVIPNGVDLELFHPGEKEKSPTILFVGTYGQRKRGKLLMDVFEREIRPSIPDAKLWMVCSDAPEAPGVEVLGKLSDEELADRYRRAWVFCLPSTYEGFGVPYIEAMASGTAIVATSNPGASEVLDNGRIGILADDSRLGHALINVLHQDDLRYEYSARARGQITRFGWDSIAGEYESALRSAKLGGPVAE